MAVHILNKPLGWTSHDVVAKARKLLGTRKVGHTGTLDPLATGVLVLLSDESTKLVPFLEKVSKDYIGYVSLGAGTPTLDAEGPILHSAEGRFTQNDANAASQGVLQNVASDQMTNENLEAVLRGFVGAQMQMPPSYSAIHVGGQRAYDLARAGKEVKLEPRAVTIHSLELQEILPKMRVGTMYPPALGEFTTLQIAVSVSSGTYIRSLARDIGEALGTVAHLAGLIRTRVGKFGLASATEIESLSPALGAPDLRALEFPLLELSAKQARDARDGKRVSSDVVGRVSLTLDGQLVAIADGDGSALKVLRAWQ
jgi:tRNA pseudouridine55 synthase